MREACIGAPDSLVGALEVKEHFPALIEIDEERFRKVLSVGLSNAVKVLLLEIGDITDICNRALEGGSLACPALWFRLAVAAASQCACPLRHSLPPYALRQRQANRPRGSTHVTMHCCLSKSLTTAGDLGQRIPRRCLGRSTQTRVGILMPHPFALELAFVCHRVWLLLVQRTLRRLQRRWTRRWGR